MIDAVLRHPDHTSGTVLLIDADAVAGRAAASELRALGHATVPVDEARIAIALLEARRFDVVLIDPWGQPLCPRSGHGELITRVTAASDGAALVLLLADGGAPALRDAVGAVHLDGIIRKPVDGVEAARVLSRVLRRRARAARRTQPDGKWVVKLLLRALALRHISTVQHCRRVASLARLIAEQMGEPRSALADCELGAMVHDIGMIGVPMEILEKPGRLTPRERRWMEEHSVIGGDILAGIEPLREASAVAAHHHERRNGLGYPAGFQDDAIPPLAHVVSVADAYDTMVTARSSTPRVTHEDAIEELSAQAGRQFEPRVVEAFESIPLDRLGPSVRRADSGIFAIAPEEPVSAIQQRRAS